MIGVRRIIRELVHDLTEARTQMWFAQEEAQQLRREVETLEAVCSEQEAEILRHKRQCGITTW